MLTESEITELYRRQGPAVFRRASKILGSVSDAHEIVQGLFLSLFERPEQYEGRSQLNTFLYSMTTNACLTHLRNQQNRKRLLDEWQSRGGTNDSLGFSAEQRVILQQALISLPSDVAQAAVYYVVDGLTHDEIARLLDCSRRHVGDLLKRLSKWESSRQEQPC